MWHELSWLRLNTWHDYLPYTKYVLNKTFSILSGDHISGYLTEF